MCLVIYNKATTELTNCCSPTYTTCSWRWPSWKRRRKLSLWHSSICNKKYTHLFRRLSEGQSTIAYTSTKLAIHALKHKLRIHTPWSKNATLCYLWSPYVIGQTIIFSSCFFLLLSSSFFFFISSPNLSGRGLDVYHTSAHGVALVRI